MSRAQLTSTVEQNSAGAAAPFVAGKNKIINGDFSIWQRGTSISITSTNQYSADRFLHGYDGTGATRTVTQQTFTPNTAGNPTNAISGGYNRYMQIAQSVAGSGGSYNLIEQRIEGAILAGQTVTFSFWAKAASSLTLPQVDMEYNIAGTNYYLGVIASSVSVGTSWAKYSYTFTMPTYSGLSPNGTGDWVGLRIWVPVNTTFTFSTWGWQLEAGSVATPFTTASGTLQGELALCQRYFKRYTDPTLSNTASIGVGYCNTTTNLVVELLTPVTMRTSPTVSWSSASYFVVDAGSTTALTCTAISVYDQNPNNITVVSSVSGSGTVTIGWAGRLRVGSGSTNINNATFDLSAEL